MGLMTGSLCVSAEEARTFKILSMWAEDDNDSGSILKNVTENYKQENPDFNYEIEVNHPFAEGNGSNGRLWHTLLLSKWNHIFAMIPN